MFFFLSKLLPLFVYPLGLSCLLAIVALILLWKRPRLAAGAVSLALAVLIIASNGWVSAGLVRSLEQQNRPTELPKASAIVVLGGATRPPEPPRPWVEVNEAGDRVFYGAKLYREQKAPIVVLAGGRVSWNGAGGSEAEDMAEMMQVMGVPRSAILQDPSSFNTRENALNVQRILEDKKLDRVLLVTSALHMPRSVKVFRRLGIEVIPAPTDFLIGDGAMLAKGESWQEILLNIMPDAYRLSLSTLAFKEYLGIFIYRLRGWA
ncbi:YdcF family protein [Oscillatoriales cyanobacterium LEGE 11467]|uniref:YdcF family protein n=1 Tax=Zarconia navalis LEGE 11467 TaxID=1828826 RepID=A0A928W2A0_9CYAN|nr:YdcF family protein [Zarconia navalis]MBE9041930.1 YdcF family protein [Zarconia navalis LEGE 11467]